MSQISSSKNKNPLYSEKLIISSNQTAIANCTAGWSDSGSGFSLTISKAGQYKLSAEFVPYTQGNSEAQWAIGVDGVNITETLKRTSNTDAGSIMNVAHLETAQPMSLVGGEVVTLRNNEAVGTVSAWWNATASNGFIKAELVDEVIPIATQVMEQYDTGWVACGDWSDQQLGDTVGSNVVHSLDTALSGLIVKVMISTDGSDGNSLEVGNTDRVLDTGSSVDYSMGHGISQVSANEILIQTGNSGFSYINSGTSGGVTLLTSESYFYKIKVIKLATQYKAPAVQRHSTGWVACSDWTDQQLGDALGGNVTHNLNEPLSKLDIKILISTDGTDANSFESIDNVNIGVNTGMSIDFVDSNTITIRTGGGGWSYLDSGGSTRPLDTETYYYQVIVTKVYSTLTATVAPVMPNYDTGWVANSDWTNQLLGTAPGGNVVHSLGYNLRELMVQVFLSTDGTDDNSFEVGIGASQMEEGAAYYRYGLTTYQIDSNNLQVQTGVNGIHQLLLGSGLIGAIDTESWYYRVVVTKIQPVISVRNISEDYTTGETDTGKQWIDGKTIYRKVINFGALPDSAAKNVAHGISYDSIIPGSPIGSFTNGTLAILVPYVSQSDNDTVRMTITATNLVLTTYASWSAYSGFVLVEYTKP